MPKGKKTTTKKNNGIQIPIMIGSEPHMIQSDNHAWIICKKKKAKNKETGLVEDTWQGYHFFGTFKGLVNYLTELKLRVSEATTFVELRDNLARIKKENQELFETNTIK